jgi:hypothetical protein
MLQPFKAQAALAPSKTKSPLLAPPSQKRKDLGKSKPLDGNRGEGESSTTSVTAYWNFLNPGRLSFPPLSVMLIAHLDRASELE